MQILAKDIIAGILKIKLFSVEDNSIFATTHIPHRPYSLSIP